jgi:hypothetical protein
MRLSSCMVDDDAVPVGTLVAVNVGQPREVSWRGRTVRTGVWKQPVHGPQRVRTLNIDGDGRATFPDTQAPIAPCWWAGAQSG